jgi:7,8-dihydroneopterin aldolase/epimerase/oxygenase
MTIFVRGLEIYAYHGCAAAEREIGHRFRIDLAVEVGDHAGADDDLGSTVDYAELARIAEQVMLREKRMLVEVLANEIAEAIFERWNLVSSLELTIAKPAPPAPMIAESVGVRLKRNRA